MYKHILLTLETSATDVPIIDHIKQLAKRLQCTVTLFHVANSPAVKLLGAEAGGEEVIASKAFLAKVEAEFKAEGVMVEAKLGFGRPAEEIIKLIEGSQIDLVAMSTHGHKFWGDLIFGVTASTVQHNVSIPVLLLRATKRE